MTLTKLARPPKDLDSFLGRKWLESLVLQNTDLGEITDLSFLLIASDSRLPNARVITGSTNVTITDGGAGTTLTLDLGNTAVTPGTYNSVDVDSKGRVTGGTLGADVVVPDEVYSASWNGSFEVPTKNAVYDKIEAIILSGLTDNDSKRLLFMGF